MTAPAWRVVERQGPDPDVPVVYLVVSQDGNYPHYRVQTPSTPSKPSQVVLVFHRSVEGERWTRMHVIPSGVIPFMLEVLGMVVGEARSVFSGPESVKGVGLWPTDSPIEDGSEDEAESPLFNLRDQVERAVTRGLLAGRYLEGSRWVTAWVTAWDESRYIEATEELTRLHSDEQMFWAQALRNGHSENDILLTILSVLAGRRHG